jgi:hypothetical protein
LEHGSPRTPVSFTGGRATTFQDQILEPFSRSESLSSGPPKTWLGSNRTSIRDPQWTTAISVLSADQEPMNVGWRLPWNASTLSRKSSDERSRL